MARKTATVSVRVEPELKEQAEKILDGLNVSVSDLITVLYRQIVIKQGVPFPIDLIEDNAEQSFRAYQHYFEYCDKRELEAVKNFAKRLKEELVQCDVVCEGDDTYGITKTGYDKNDVNDTIDNLVNKMVIKKNGGNE